MKENQKDYNIPVMRPLALSKINHSCVSYENSHNECDINKAADGKCLLLFFSCELSLGVSCSNCSFVFFNRVSGHNNRREKKPMMINYPYITDLYRISLAVFTPKGVYHAYPICRLLDMHHQLRLLPSSLFDIICQHPFLI